MSLAARTTQQGLSKPQDENSRFQAKQAKPAGATQGRRAGGALSDITNVTAHQQANQVASKVCCLTLNFSILGLLAHPYAPFIMINIVHNV